MKVLDIQQGTDEWRAVRAKYFTASEASIMMGTSSVMKRNELLRQKKTLSEREFDDWFQRNILDKGHEIEALARPIAEKMIGEDLFPVVGVCDNDYLLASFDGLTMNERICWECKQWNEEKAAQVRAGFLPPDDEWQVSQQLVVSKADKCLYMITDGTEERTVTLWVDRHPEDEARLLAAWHQFGIDLEAYIPVEEKAPIVARPVTDLPAVSVQVKGQIDVADNFKAFEAALRDFVEKRLIREPKTDQDFADLDLQIKALQKAEDALDAAETHVFAQIASIDSIKRMKDMLHKLARDNRLASEKLLKAKKESIRNEIILSRQTAWQEHIAQINKTLGGKIVLPTVAANFAEVIKNKRTIASLQDAVDTELARVKIASDAIANKIRLNLAALREHAAGYEFLFTDAQQLVLKDCDDLINLIKSRVGDHKEQERQKEDRMQAEADRKAREKVEREAAEKAEKERKAMAQAAADKLAESQAQIDRGLIETLGEQTKPAAAVASATPAPQQSQPAATRTPVPTAQAKHARPTDTEIIQLVMTHYKVDKQTAIDWLMEFQFKAVG